MALLASFRYAMRKFLWSIQVCCLEIQPCGEIVRLVTFNAKQFDVRLENFKVFSVEQNEIVFMVRPEVTGG